jgi:hypothetical protein
MACLLRPRATRVLQAVALCLVVTRCGQGSSADSPAAARAESTLEAAAEAVIEAAPEALVDDAIAPSGDPIRLIDAFLQGDCYTWLKDTRREDPRRIFTVEDGVLRIGGDGLGGIVTNARYRDYHLVLEFRWGGRTWRDRQTAARDSGLLVHSNGIDGGYGGSWMPSIEVQIIEGGVGDLVPVPGRDHRGDAVPIAYTARVSRDRDGEWVWDPTGEPQVFAGPALRRVNWYGRDPDWKDEIGIRGPHDLDSPLGQWTRLDVLCDGDRIVVFVNGTKANEAYDVSPAAGRIQLQTELAEIHVRRWELWPIDRGPEPVPAVQE